MFRLCLVVSAVGRAAGEARVGVVLLQTRVEVHTPNNPNDMSVNTSSVGLAMWQWDPWQEEELADSEVHDKIGGPLPPDWVQELKSQVSSEVENGFPSKPEENGWGILMGDIVKRGQENPANAQFVANGFGWPGGFTSRANMFLNELAMAMYFNRSVSICNSTCTQEAVLPFYDLPFAIYNDPSRTFASNWRLDESANCSVAAALLGRSFFAPNLLEQDFRFSSRLKTFLHKSVLVLKPEVRANIVRILGQAGFGQNLKFVAVHIRHGDKGIETALLPFETYAQAVMEALDRPGVNRSVYIASDDPGAQAAMKELLPSDVEVLQRYDVGSGGRSYGDKDTFFNFLVDVEAMKMAEVFIGTYSSNVGAFVFHGRNYSQASVSLDVNWTQVPRISSDAMWLQRV